MAKNKAKIVTHQHYPVSQDEFRYAMERITELQKEITDLKEFKRKIQIDVSSWALYGNS